MPSASQIAFAATIGNLLQGWDNGAMAGALLYLKPELGLDGNPLLEGIVVGSMLVGALSSTLCSGPGSDWLGRRVILCIAASSYTLSSCIMFWSCNVFVLLLGRLLVGISVGIAVTIVPIYIAETAPPEIRGRLSTLPQFMGSGGIFLSYAVCFALSLQQHPSWRLMLGILLAPSLIFLISAVFFLPESPRWLVSKGKMAEAKKVLQKLRNKDDVSAELALLVEGLGAGAQTSTLQEWVIEPIDIKSKGSFSEGGSTHVLYTPEEGASWLAKPLEDSGIGSRSQLLPLVDPVVSMVGSINTQGLQLEPLEEVEETALDKEESEMDDSAIDDIDMELGEEPTLTAPLLSSSSRLLSELPCRRSSFTPPAWAGSAGSGWQLAWDWDGNKNSELKRVFLYQGQQDEGGSMRSLPGIDQGIQAVALVGQPAQSFLNLGEEVSGPAMLHPAETAVKGPAWSDLLEPGVLRALIVGVTLQLLQQLSGINAVLYYVPQILNQSGANSLLAKLGLGSASASILASEVTCFIVLPCIALSMYLMDRTGRRRMLLVTLFILLLSLILMVVSSSYMVAGTLQAISSFLGVTLYLCTFAMGFGPIPNILGSEIFPTRVRGLCIGLCQATMWTCNILLTNMFPVLLANLGIGGLFGCFAVVVTIAWIFTYTRVPETKGMPLEVITEIFAVSSK